MIYIGYYVLEGTESLALGNVVSPSINIIWVQTAHSMCFILIQDYCMD